MAKIDPLFETMLSQDGSDLHLTEGSRPKIRQYGRLVEIDQEILDSEMIRAYLGEICPQQRWDHFVRERDLDFAHEFADRARFRVNYYCHANGMGAVFRLIPPEIKTLDELQFPPVFKTFGLLRSGFIVVTGPTGCGKSTTLAALVDLINSTTTRHIVTIEQPIEFVHTNKRSIVCQREVGIDVRSFAEGLHTAIRQDCDVIMVSEIRDHETISLAMNASAMGSLVFATMPTMSAIKTVDRLINIFPTGKQAQARTMLSECLKAVCTQLLLKTADGQGRVASTEVLVANQALSNSVREGNTQNIRNIIQSGRAEGMQLMDDSIQQLLKDERITREEAALNATDRSRFTQETPVF